MTKKPSSAQPAESMQPYQRQLQHLVELAKLPAWRAHACWRVLELEADSSGLWAGLQSSVLSQVSGLEKTMASVAQEFKRRH